VYIYAKFYPIDNQPIHSSSLTAQTYIQVVNQLQAYPDKHKYTKL